MEPNPSSKHVLKLKELLQTFNRDGQTNYYITFGYVYGDVFGIGFSGAGNVIGKNIHDASIRANRMLDSNEKITAIEPSNIYAWE
jgi:hypothetical protein